MKKLLFISLCLTVVQLNAQNVGINTDGSLPTMMLHIKTANVNSPNGIIIDNTGGANADAIIQLQNAGTSTWTFGFDDDNSDRFIFDNGSALTTTNILSLETTGDVGIGINDPTAMLTVNGDAIFNESGGSNDFRIESNTEVNAMFVNGANDQVGFFVPGSPIAALKWEVNKNEAIFPISRFINTNAAGTPLIGVGQNDASGGSWVSGVGIGGASLDAYGVSGYSTTNAVEAFGGYFENDGAFAKVGGWESGPWVQRKIIGNGSVSTIVNDENNNKVSMTCPETPEILFQDYGVGQLQNGTTHIDIDPILSKNIHVDADHPIKIFIQLEGECNGVYVTNKSATGFDVIELGGGNSSVPFSYSLTANRADVVISYSDGTTKTSENTKVRFSPVKNYLPPSTINENKRVMLDYNSKPVNR